MSDLAINFSIIFVGTFDLAINFTIIFYGFFDLVINFTIIFYGTFDLAITFTIIFVGTFDLTINFNIIFVEAFKWFSKTDIIFQPIKNYSFLSVVIYWIEHRLKKQQIDCTSFQPSFRTICKVGNYKQWFSSVGMEYGERH
jgi:hypothetical protein